MALSDTSGQTTTPSYNWRELLQTIVVLFKLRIVFLLVVAATGGAFIASDGWPGLDTLLLTWITGTMAAAGASSLNQYWERERDKSMGRTSKRPLAQGQIANPILIPIIGVLLIVVPSIAVLPTHPALTFWLLAGAIIYVPIYTMWLKPRTILNIVIGGAAGSAAVLSGSAAAGAWAHPGAIILALILFLWTPFHFWSLAILYRDDYQSAEFPMLPAQTTPEKAAWWVLSHTAPTAIAGLMLALLPTLGWLYLVPMLLITTTLVYHNVRLIQQTSKQNARAMFLSSNNYLLILLVMICLDVTL